LILYLNCSEILTQLQVTVVIMLSSLTLGI